MITAGIDCGAKTTKTVIMKDGKIIGKGKVHTGFDQGKAAAQSLEIALKEAGLSADDVERTYGTGSGKDAIKNVQGKINDIMAMGKGAHYFFPHARTVVDVGAEEGRAANLGKDGSILDFAVNEKCSAGAGSFIEAMGRALETRLEDMGPLALESTKEIPMNAQCAIFAESEVVGLIHAKTDIRDISKAIHDATASRVVSMIRGIGAKEDLVMLGGVAYNAGIVEAMKRQLNLQELRIPDSPEYGMAVGAAVAAAQEG